MTSVKPPTPLVVAPSARRTPRRRTFGGGSTLVYVVAAVVVAADTLNFAPMVFISAFVLILAAAALAAGLAIGLGARDAVRRHFEERSVRGRTEEMEERSLWHHL